MEPSTRERMVRTSLPRSSTRPVNMSACRWTPRTTWWRFMSSRRSSLASRTSWKFFSGKPFSCKRSSSGSFVTASTGSKFSFCPVGTGLLPAGCPLLKPSCPLSTPWRCSMATSRISNCLSFSLATELVALIIAPPTVSPFMAFSRAASLDSTSFSAAGSPRPPVSPERTIATECLLCSLLRSADSSSSGASGDPARDAERDTTSTVL
mmetsp:Transcript_64290/g.139914  ORF Transcript_64290/g.139914 Transcript_64290/m.139914 type:complete len:208 (+) Transcript_64290:297-920(+)